MVQLYKSADENLPRFDTFKSYDASGQEVTGAIPEDNPLYGLPADQQEAALAELQKPPTGEELAMALAMKPDFEKVMTQEEFLRYDDYMKTVETDWIEGIMTGAGMVVDEIGKGLSAAFADDEKLKRAIPTLAEGFARGTRDMYGLVAQSADPQSAAFKFKALLTGDGTPEERFQQFKEAREFNRRSMEIMEGKANVTDIDPDLINPELAQALSYVADPSWLIPYVGQAGKAMGLSMKSVGLAKLSEQIAVVGAMTEHAKRLAMGGMLKVAGAPLSLLGDATTRTITWGADRASDAFSFATGMAYQDARRIVREGGLYGGTIFRVPYMSTISDAYVAGWGAKGLGEALGMLGEGIMGRKRGVYSYAEEALAAGKDVLSPQAKAMLRIINQADPILSYGYAAMDGMVTGSLVGGALGYYSARGEGAAQGIGMGAVMGAGGALMGRGWAGMAREGGIIHQRVQAEMEFVKNAMKDVDPEKLAQIETLEQLAATHGQDLSWQILGILKLAPDVKLNITDSVGFELQRRRMRESGFSKDGTEDPLFGLDLDDPNEIKKLQQYWNFEGMVAQLSNGQITLHINADHYKKFTFGHELFHGVMRASPMQDEFVKDLREKLLGRVTPDGVEFPGVIEPSKMRSFMERYIKAAYSNNPEQMQQRLRALDESIKAYERDGTLIPGQDPNDARPVLDIMVEEAGAYYFSHMINGKDMDWLYRGGDLGGLRQVIDDAKEGLRNFFEAKFGGAGMDFNAARTLHEAFLKGGKEGGKRIRIGALDALMTDIIRRQAGTQEGRMLDLGDMNGEQQRRFRERHGLGDVLQPRKNGGMDNRRRTAAEESTRAKQAVDALRAMNDAERTSTTIVEKNGDVTIHGDLSDAELNQLVRVGVMMPTEATRYRLFRDTIANKGKGANVFGGTLVGESFEMGEGKAPPRLRRSKGDKVPITHREFMPIELRTEIKLTKNGKGKATFVVTGLDIKNADMRLRDLWHREDVQKAWGGDYNAFAADFYLYLENISDPNGVPSAEYFGGGKNGSYKRNVFHEAFGAAMREGETPFNEPSPTYKGAAGRGEKFVIYSMSLGSMYDVKLRDRNVPYNHSIAYDRIRRNWSPAEMRQEPLGDGEKLTHEATGYSFVKGPNGKWRAYDQYRRVIGVADNAEAAAQIGRRSYLAEQDRIAKTVKNFSVNEKTEITAKGWAPAFFSAVEKFVKSGAITPNMSPEQVWARIRKANYAGIRADEVRFLGLEAKLLGGDNAHLQNAREMDAKVKELFAYSQRFASQDPAKFARVQEVAAKLRRSQMEEQAKGEALRKKEQSEQGFAPGKPIGQAGLDALTKHLQDRAIGLRMVDEGNGYASYVMDGMAIQGTYKIFTARSNQRTGVNGHFGDDVVVHIRVDERMDPVTGKAVLVVHEIQANNAENRTSENSPERVRERVRNFENILEDNRQKLQKAKERVNTEAHKIASQLRVSTRNSPYVGYGDENGAIAAASSKYERERIGVAMHNANAMIMELERMSKGHMLGFRAVGKFHGSDNGVIFNPSQEFKAEMRKEFDELRKEVLEILLYVQKNKAFPMYDAVESKYATLKAVVEMLSYSPFNVDTTTARSAMSMPGFSPLLKGSLGNVEAEAFGNETILVGEAMRRAMLKLSRTKRHEMLELTGVAKRALNESVKKANADTSLTAAERIQNEADAVENILSTFAGLRFDDSSLYNYTGFYQVDNNVYGNNLFTGAPWQMVLRDLIIGSKEYNPDGTVALTKTGMQQPDYARGPLVTDTLHSESRARYDHIINMAGRELLDATLKVYSEKETKPEIGRIISPEGVRTLRKISERNPTGILSASDLGFIGNIALNPFFRNIMDVGQIAEGYHVVISDTETRLMQDRQLLKGSSEGGFIMQTPQDWVAIGLKMAIRRAAEKGISTIVFTDHMGAPSKCGMEYVSASKLYTEILPTLGNGFLRQYNAKIEMPVLPKVYKFGGLENGKVKVIGDNGGISWQEQLGMSPQFRGARQPDGSISYRVQYEQSYGRGALSPGGNITQQQVHLAQMKNNPRLDIPPELGRVALEEGFFNLSPSEGGDAPANMPAKGSKDISELGNESFATGKNKFNKATGMYFRERETGRWYTASYASEGAGVVYFEPVDLRNKYIETQDDAIREQIDAEIQSQKIVIRSDTQGLGYRGIENKMKERFDSYSKKEPSLKPSDEVKPDAPDFDIATIRANADAIKDALTSLDGLGFTKDETFRLFGRRTAKGRTLGIIDEINAEIDKAKAGEEPDMAKVEEKLTELEEMRDEMQEKQENTPEGLQETESYQNREENIDAINEAIDDVRGLMEPPKGGDETRNMSVAENVGEFTKGPYRGASDALSALEMWAAAAKAGRLGPDAKNKHKLITPEVLKTVEWLLTNDNSGVTSGRPASFATIAEALEFVRKVSLYQHKGPSRRWIPDSLVKSYKDAWLASSAILDKPTKKPRNPNVEPKAKDGASFDDWFNWARKKRVNGKSMATARNALKFIAEMPGEGYYRAVAQMLLAMGPVGFLDMQLHKTSRGFMRYGSGGNVGKLAISESGGGKSGTDVSLAGRIDNANNSTVATVIEEVMHAAQMTNSNYGPMKLLKSFGSKGTTWKLGALKFITSVEGEIKGKTYNQLSGDVKERLMVARLAKLILEGTKGIDAIAEGSGKTYDLHEALFGSVVSTGGVWRNEGDPSKGGGAGKKLRFRFKTKEQVGQGKLTQVTGYHFGNVAEFLVGLFSEPDLARFYFDKPPVDLSSLTPKGDPLRTSWRNLASQMIAVAMDFFNGLFGSKKKNYGSQLIEETVLMLQRQVDGRKNTDAANEIDVQIGTNEVGFTREPVAPEPEPEPRQRGRQPTPGGEPIPMGMNQNETGLAVVGGQEATRGNEVGPAIPIVEAEATPLPRRGPPPQPRLEGPDRQVPAVQYAYPRPSTPVGLTPIRWTGDAMAGQGILQSTAGYMVVLVKGKWRVYNPEKQIIAVMNDEEKAKELADRRARRR